MAKKKQKKTKNSCIHIKIDRVLMAGLKTIQSTIEFLYIRA